MASILVSEHNEEKTFGKMENPRKLTPFRQMKLTPLGHFKLTP